MENPLLIRLIVYPVVIIAVAFFLFGCASAPKQTAKIDLKCYSHDNGPVKGFFLGESLEVNILKGSCEEL